MNSLAKPPRENRPWALWIWNLSIRRGDMLEQLEAIAQNGFAGVVVRPGREMDPPLLSQEFLDLFGALLDAAAQSGLAVRLGDDFFHNWSGVFQPLTLRDVSTRVQKLTLISIDTVNGTEAFERTFDNPAAVVCMAQKMTNGKPDSEQVRPIALSGKGGVSWKAPTGEWRVLVFRKLSARDASGNYLPNTYNPVVAEYYIATVLEQMRSRFSKHIPAVFEGFVTEMPPLTPQDKAMFWHDDLVNRFRAKHKKELLNLLPELFLEIDSHQAKNRLQVQDFLFRSMYESFAVPLENWAKKHRLTQWVLCTERGMSSESETRNAQFRIPENGFTSIGFQNHDGTDNNYAGLRAISDINTNQYRRKTVSVLGRSSQGSSSSIQDLKQQIDRSLFSGPSTVLMDGHFFNLDRRGHGSTPYNPFWYSSEWESAKQLCAYSARMQMLMAQSHYSCDIAVLMPSASVLAESAVNSTEAVPRGFAMLGKVITELERLKYSYDIVSEELVLSCAIRANGEFATADRIRKGNYLALLVPHCWLMSRNLLGFLEKLVAKKGRVIFIEEAPAGTLEDGVVASVTARLEKILAQSACAQVAPLKGVESAVSQFASPIARITVQGKPVESIICSHASGPGCEIYLLHNTSNSQEHFCTVEVSSGEKHAAYFDPAPGTLEEVETYKVVSGRGTLQINFLPRQTTVLILSASKLSTPHKGKKSVSSTMVQPKNYRLILKNEWEFTPGSMNVLPLAAWNTRIGLSREFGGYSHFYEAYFEIKDLPSQCLLLSGDIPGQGWDSEGPNTLVEVTVNGNHIEENRKHLVVAGHQEAESPVAAIIAANPYMKGAVAYDIRGTLDKGFNRVTIRTAGAQGIPPVIVYPPILAGDFAIEKGLRGWTITMQRMPVGSDTWTNYGYPYLTGTGVYRQVFEVPSEYNQLILRCTHVSGSVQVILNGKDIGSAPWSPFQFDITAACDSKRNELVLRVVNTIDNMLRLTRRPSGIRGEISLDVY